MEAGNNIRIAAADRDWLAEEVEDWGIDRQLARLLLIGPVIFAAFVALTVVNRTLYGLLVDEDSIVEWVQFAVLLGIIAMGPLLARALLRHGERAAASLVVLSTLVVVFIAGEEVSWGQRVFGWGTPEQLAALNRQGETNIHNIGSVLTVFNLGMMTIAFAAAILPVAWRAWAGPRRRRGIEILFIPPLFLTSSFLIAALYRFVRFTLIPEGRYVVSHYQEVTELIFYVAVLAFLVLILRRLREPAFDS